MFLSILLLANLSFAQTSYTISGAAQNLESGKFAYQEIHQVELNEKNLNKMIHTTYKTGEGKTFAKMTSDFSKDPLLPEISFEDFRFGSTIKQQLDLERKKIFLIKGSTREEIKLEPNMVSGQGFDNFIKINFDSKPNIEIPISFVVLEKLDFFRFSLTPGVSTKTTKEFSLNIKSVFLKLFASTIKVQYDTDKKRLLRYEGLSNLADNESNNQNVIIDYKYEN